LAISAVTIVFAILSQTINGILQGYGKANVPVIALTVGVVVKIISNVCLLRIDGIYEKGAAIGNVLCHLTTFIIVYIVLLRTINFKFSLFRLSFRPILATLIMGVSSYNIYKLLIEIFSIRISVLVTIFIAIVVFFLCILLLRVFSKEEILMLPSGSKLYKIFRK